MEAGRTTTGGWRRAAALLAVTLLFSIARPVPLVLLPFGVLALTIPPRRARVVALGAVAAAFAVAAEGAGPEWMIDGGWSLLVAGAFGGVTLFRPCSTFISRALGAVMAGLVISGGVLAFAPGGWGVVDWMVESRLREGASAALTALREVRGGGALPSSFVMAIYDAADLQLLLFPALLALATMAGLGVAWWSWIRLTRERDDGLGALADFRFSDQLVWILVAGLVLLLTPVGEPWQRAGGNALAFMAALYAVRGAAVLLFLTGGVSLLGALLLGAGLLFLAPFVLSGAFIVGLSDTWIDLRERLREVAE